ncbi:MAG: hypothetical protein LBI13_08305 [Streptococcaceae bacterium]|jgi:hypothetical protein|nr:hypothetical protein [Streptococcaceae bacterium]
MLPTMQLRLGFDNKEIRYLGSIMMKQQFEASNVFVQILMGHFSTWIGNEFDIDSEGNLTINEKFHYTSKELYQNSHEHYTTKKGKLT